MRGARLVLLLFLSVTAGAISAAAGAGAEEPVVVAFGDSLTAGLAVAREAYPALLERAFARKVMPIRVVNAGVPRHDRGGASARRLALRLKPAIVIVELGANDALRGQDLGGVRANLDTIVERFQASGARVLVAGMRVPTNYGDRYGAGFERLFAEVAAKHKAAFMPFFLDGVAADARLNQADGIHPTAEGYRIIADRLWPYLRPLLQK